METAIIGLWEKFGLWLLAFTTIYSILSTIDWFKINWKRRDIQEDYDELLWVVEHHGKAEETRQDKLTKVLDRIQAVENANNELTDLATKYKNLYERSEKEWNSKFRNQEEVIANGQKIIKACNSCKCDMETAITGMKSERRLIMGGSEFDEIVEKLESILLSMEV